MREGIAMIDVTSKNERRRKRQQRGRHRYAGSPARPRLNIYRSLNHIYGQIVDDQAGAVLVSASSRTKALSLTAGGNVAAARAVGQALAARAREKGIEAVVFDRAGYPYHGRVRALAEAAREAGLKF